MDGLDPLAGWRGKAVPERAVQISLIGNLFLKRSINRCHDNCRSLATATSLASSSLSSWRQSAGCSSSSRHARTHAEAPRLRRLQCALSRCCQSIANCRLVWRVRRVWPYLSHSQCILASSSARPWPLPWPFCWVTSLDLRSATTKQIQRWVSLLYTCVRRYEDRRSRLLFGWASCWNYISFNITFAAWKWRVQHVIQII